LDSLVSRWLRWVIDDLLMQKLSENKIHLFFVISLFLKGAFAFFEIIGGFIAYGVAFVGGVSAHFITQQSFLNFVSAIAAEELAEGPRDFIANYLLQGAQNLSAGSLRFVAFYLVSHGVIKLWLIIGLLRKKLWYYPTAMIVFGSFIIYQLYRFSFTHSLLLLFITGVDVIVIWLTWHEYKYLQRVLPRYPKNSPPTHVDSALGVR